MSARGVIEARESGAREWFEVMPFVGTSPRTAVAHVMRTGEFASVRYVPHKKAEVTDDGA
ncbi:hypothetical protein SEA_JACKO_90 [Microbacterium phage Jacko]|nr:hypothetical protein SEA_JACKO_90 [Microbacterium phage Jacko]